MRRPATCTPARHHLSPGVRGRGWIDHIRHDLRRPWCWFVAADNAVGVGQRVRAMAEPIMIGVPSVSKCRASSLALLGKSLPDSRRRIRHGT